jgi:hypothetical protein
MFILIIIFYVIANFGINIKKVDAWLTWIVISIRILVTVMCGYEILGRVSLSHMVRIIFYLYSYYHYFYIYYCIYYY